MGGSEPGATTPTNNYEGLVQTFYKGIDYVHIIVHRIQIYVSSNLQFSSIEEGLKTFRREATEGSHPEESEKELRLGFTSKNNLYYL